MPSLTPNRNIELKARVHSLERVGEICREFAQFSAHERQVDTYFTCQQGRLKLRERGTQAAQLVAYARPDETTPRASDYWLVPVAEPSLLKAALTAALGVRVVVEKDRQVFLYRNVRIHLDRVACLGDFLELEAVLGGQDDEREATRLVAELAQRLGVESSDRVDCSYSDLLLSKTP
ncbi:MAG TPA: class IV adenylate cyclase [Pirellulales bacterium]|nr:class IV adenylate cyclase [Pirellulales bacterium]